LTVPLAGLVGKTPVAVLTWFVERTPVAEQALEMKAILRGKVVQMRLARLLAEPA
jgi:hypothetical protein